MWLWRGMDGDARQREVTVGLTLNTFVRNVIRGTRGILTKSNGDYRQGSVNEHQLHTGHDRRPSVRKRRTLC